ncbi:MAG: PRC-barrel domain-containing protein, partial [Candidatus Thorarchaeota archaeon]
MTFECVSVRFSDIKNMDVLDSNGEKLGRANDFLFEWKDGKIALQSVIMGGNRLEEFLESIGIKTENDPVFGVDCIERIEDAVYLKSECASLGESYNPEGGKPEFLKLSKLSKIKVIDSDGFKVGNVIDVWFDSCSEVHLLLGGGFLEETLEKLR